MAPANQLRLSSAGSEDGEAETETCRVAKPLWRKTTRTSGPQGLYLTEPPGADPHAGWCGRGEWATTPPMPICTKIIWLRNSGCPPWLRFSSATRVPSLRKSRRLGSHFCDCVHGRHVGTTRILRAEAL